MCGIFGFITRQGEGPEMARLRRLALITQTRGMHAFGLAWLEEGGTIQTFKAAGPAEAHLDELERCRNAVIVIGHCRFATHGSPADNRNNHPHAAGAGVIMHNGVVFNHRQLAWQYDLRLQSQCDSEVLGLLNSKENAMKKTTNHNAKTTSNSGFFPEAKAIPGKPSMLTDREMRALGGEVAGKNARMGNGWQYTWDQAAGLWVRCQ